MLIAIDVGNTNIVLGGFRGETLIFQARIHTNTHKTSDEYAATISAVLNNYGVDFDCVLDVIISSVVPQVTGPLASAMQSLCGKRPFVVGPGIKTGINIRIDDPATLGADLLTDSVAAAEQYKLPVIVVDMGTATTISVVDDKRAFIGGVIMPGLRLAQDALSDRTAQLPHIDLKYDGKVLGTNTVDCMKSGAIYGTAAMIDGVVSRIENELGHKCTVVATGGLAEQVCKYTECGAIYDPDLMLKGLLCIYNRNRRK